MYVKIEPSGCCERKGLVQVRFDLYLDKGDYEYDKCHIQVPVFPKGGYPGEVEEIGGFKRPKNTEGYKKWERSLPKTWIDTPFHIHITFFEIGTTNTGILDVAEAILHEAGIKWSLGQRVTITDMPVELPSAINTEHLSAVNARVQTVKSITEVRSA